MRASTAITFLATECPVRSPLATELPVRELAPGSRDLEEEEKVAAAVTASVAVVASGAVAGSA
jgi:hypothetical protein